MHRAPAPLALLLVLLAVPAVAPLQDGGVAVAVVGEEAVEGRDGPGCKRGDGFYRPGTTWQEDDGCLSCSCDRGGQARCQAFMCQVTCDNPRRVQGECCPACDGLSVVTQSQSCPSLGNCTLKCTHGFVLDDLGCYACQCQQGAACTLECPAGYARDAAGNELCECACPAMETCSKRCAHGYRRDQGGCSQCACLPGMETSEPVVGKGAPPKNCQDALRERDDGEYWWDGCRGCYCHGGATLCELASCRDAPTSLRHVVDHALCDSPSGLAGLAGLAGPTGLAAGCAACRCVRGRALCEVAACPPAACAHPLPPDPMGCCPTCPDSTATAAQGPGCAGGHAHGTSWRESDCRSCRCVAGATECFEQRCGALQCDLQFTPRGMCCPVCLGDGAKSASPAKPPHPGAGPQGAAGQDGAGLLDSGGAGARAGRPSALCWWRGQALAPAEEWLPDDCTLCQCDPAGSGSITCTQAVCPACGSQPGRAAPGRSGAPGLAAARLPYCCPPCAEGGGDATLLVSLLAVVALLVLAVLALGYCVWQRSRRQTLDIARADATRTARPVATYTYNMIPSLSR